MNTTLLSDALDFVMVLNAIEKERIEFMLSYIKDSGLRHHIALKINSNKRFSEYVLSRMSAKDREAITKAMEENAKKTPSLSVILGLLRHVDETKLSEFEDMFVENIVVKDTNE